MSKDTYFQFPLSALAFGVTTNDRLGGIISHSFILAGYKLLCKLNAEAQQQFFAEMQSRYQLPRDFNTEEWIHRAAVYGAAALNIRLGDLSESIKRYRMMDKHISRFRNTHGRDPYVRMKKDWVFDVRDGKRITYREFSVLCAIYSAIGDKELARITRERIRRCALGYRKASIMATELRRREDRAQPLTDGELRTTIQRLHRNRFFARCTVGRRITYYSIRLDGEALRKKVLERHTYPDHFRASQAAQDQILTDAIKEKRREAAAGQQNPAITSPRFTWTPPDEQL